MNWLRIIAVCGLLSVLSVMQVLAQGAMEERSNGVRVFLAPTERDSLPAFSGDTFMVPKRPRIGLVLSGGGARGLSQIGIIQALEEAGIEPSLIVGTSIGSVIGGLYASGYTIARLKRTAKEIDWRHIMRVTEETRREFIAIDRRPSTDRSIFTVRFDGLRPVLPQAVSNGQKLTNLMNELTLQSLYHSNDFDNLKIPFRAVATDLYSGRRIVLRDGLLGEAIRASATVPVVFSPIIRDSLALVDGGLRSNIPVDVAASEGCDIIIAVNTSSPLRTGEAITNPLESLDQVLNIVMYQDYARQLSLADVVIAPDLRTFTAQDFQRSDSLIAAGYAAAKPVARQVAQLVRQAMVEAVEPDEGPLPASLQPLSETDIGALLPGYAPRESLPQAIALSLMNTGMFDSVAVRVAAGSGAARTDVFVSPKPVITKIRLEGIEELEDLEFPGWILEDAGMVYSLGNLRALCENILDIYRSYGFSLARVESSQYRPDTGELIIHMNEGRIGDIAVEGNVRTDPIIVLREFPLSEGEIFRIQDARRGLDNIAGLELFHQVHFEIRQKDSLPQLVIGVNERPTNTLSIGLLVDNERNGQLLAELKDASIFGTGTSLSALFFGGMLNQTYKLSYSTNRLFYTRLQFTADGYYDTHEFNEYASVPVDERNRFEQAVTGEYDRTVYGVRGTLGWYVERFGLLHAGMRYERQHVRFRDAKTDLENHALVALGFGTTIDTQNRLPYPTNGLLMNALYETAQTALGSELAFTRFSFSYELFISGPLETFTFHPRVEFGYGDRTMPKAEEFRLGGQRSFYGARENEYNGRQLFAGSLEARYLLPIQIFFDTFLSVRYDIGRTWEQPENLKFQNFLHGIGLSLGLDTPIGPADFAVGRSFLTRRNADFPFSFGPMYLYFSIGAGLPMP